MTTEDLNAPTGEQTPQTIPGETIATEMPSLPTSDEPPAAEPEQIETEEVVEEEPAAVSAEPAKPDKTKPPLDWKERRRIEETNKRRAAEARAEAAEAELAKLRSATPAATSEAPKPTPAATLTPEQAKAAAKAELEAEHRAREFEAATGRILEDGQKNIPDFEAARQEMVANFGDQLNARPDFFEALIGDDVPNAHDVFYTLAKDPEQTEKLLSMPPLRMAKEIARLSEKLAKPATPEPKPISKAPAPVKPVGGAPAAATRLDDPNIPMEDFAKNYLKQMAGKGR